MGDKLVSSIGEDLIVEDYYIKLTEELISVYNFQVEDFHTYFVGDCAAWVHNADYSPEKMQKIQERQKAGHEYEKNQHEQLKKKNPTAEDQVRVSQ